ncbi:MAG: Crp/Fnr family transcriptional regulator [Lachnospiraceae bacterium]
MNFTFLAKTILFRGCSEQEIETVCRCLHFVTKSYRKGETIFRSGDTTSDIGLVLSGSVRIENNDVWGNKSILSIVEKGSVFAEAYACIPNEPLLVDVIANEACELLFVNVPQLFQPCGNACPYHHKLIRNLVTVSAKKSLHLTQRMFHTSPKTIRGRLLSYFSQQAAAQKSNKIVIPFDRQQLADYLNLDRSALSKELGKMKKEGLLDYRKNVFELNIR